jgi:glycosyltransferase involved in cell wall biosynthesis
MNGLPEAGIILDIYGDPEVFPDYARELRAQGRHPGIRFNGPVSRERIWAVLAELDALVMPTLWYEASPATIREAFAAGLPVIASDLGAPTSMIRDGVDGLLFPPGDVERLRSLLQLLLAAPERLDQLRAGISPVRSESEHVEQILAIYGEALSGVAPTLP